MKKLLKILLYSICSILGLIILIALITVLWISISGNHTAKKNMALESPEVKTLTIDGFTFRDLNKNGKLDPYEDKRQPGEVRINDLLSQMNLEEKAGTMVITMINMKKDGSISEKPFLGDFFSFFVPGTSQMLFGKKLNHFNILSAAGKKHTAEWYNHIQKLAERTRLGIPVTIASDPRNHFSNNPLTSAMAGDFSLFPEPLGLAAIGDSLVTNQFADMAIIRINAPSQHLKGSGLMGLFIRGGDLDFKEKEKAEILSLLKKVPTIVDIYLDRPTVIPEIAAASKGLFADFGANDDALLDVVFGKFNPRVSFL